MKSKKKKKQFPIYLKTSFWKFLKDFKSKLKMLFIASYFYFFQCAKDYFVPRHLCTNLQCENIQVEFHWIKIKNLNAFLRLCKGFRLQVRVN